MLIIDELRNYTFSAHSGCNEYYICYTALFPASAQMPLHMWELTQFEWIASSSDIHKISL